MEEKLVGVLVLLELGGIVLEFAVEDGVGLELDGEDTEALDGLCACAREASCYKVNKRQRQRERKIGANQDNHIRTSERIHPPHGYL